MRVVAQYHEICFNVAFYDCHNFSFDLFFQVSALRKRVVVPYTKCSECVYKVRTQNQPHCCTFSKCNFEKEISQDCFCWLYNFIHTVLPKEIILMMKLEKNNCGKNYTKIIISLPILERGNNISQCTITICCRTVVCEIVRNKYVGHDMLE